MAAINVKVKLQSTASPYFKTTTKNPRNVTGKLKLRKYDPVVKRHVDFEEKKVK